MGRATNQTNQIVGGLNSTYPDGPSTASSEDLYNYGLLALLGNTTNIGKHNREDMTNLLSYLTHLGDQQFSKEQNDLAWARNNPSAQLQQLMALGMTRSQALSVIQGGTATPAVAAAANPLSTDAGIGFGDAVNAVGTAASTISSVVRTVQACKMFGVQYDQAKSQAKMASLGAEYQQMINDGQKLTGELFGAYDSAKTNLGHALTDSDGTESVDSMIETIKKAAENGDESAADFLKDVLPKWKNSAAARNISAGTYSAHIGTKVYNPTEKDQHILAAKMYAESEQEQKKVEELTQSIAWLVKQGEKADADINYTNSLTEYTNGALTDLAKGQTAQSQAQAELNRQVARQTKMDADISEATFHNVKQSAIAKAHIEFETLKGCDDAGIYRATVARMLSDEDTAMYLAALAKQHASDSNSFWTSPEAESLRKQTARFYDPEFRDALKAIAEGQEAAAKTFSEGLDFGVFKVQLQRRASYLFNTLYDSNFDSQVPHVDNWSRAADYNNKLNGK